LVKGQLILENQWVTNLYYKPAGIMMISAVA
jgi:hypothetical protein